GAGRRCRRGVRRGRRSRARRVPRARRARDRERSGRRCGRRAPSAGPYLAVGDPTSARERRRGGYLFRYETRPRPCFPVCLPVVLLVHGTATTATETWPEGLGKTLPLAGFDWCMVQLPDRALGDIQISNQYVVAAVRTLARRTRRRVDLIGHSQGGLQTRWAI